MPQAVDYALTTKLSRFSPIHSVLLLALVLFLAGCGESVPRQQVVLYTSLNEPTARSVLDAFTDATGIEVVLVADTERDKTVGLVQTLIRERSNPRADVFWNSEAANSVLLAQEGVLEPLAPPPAGAARIPAEFSDPDGYWHGFAARARVIIVNTELVAEEDYPDSIWDIADPEWRGQTAIVRPVTGTTLTHLTAIYEMLGDEVGDQFVDAVLANEAHLPPGNGRLAQLVGEGHIAFGLTDTSDYRLVRNTGSPVTAIYPDQDGIGTLLIPNTVGRVAGGPNPENARALIEFLLSEQAEEILAFHQRGHIPLKPDVPRPQEVIVPGEFRTMEVDMAVVGPAIPQRLEQFDARFP